MSDRHQHVLAILGYHKIGDPADGAYPTWNYIQSEPFAEHLRILRNGRWAVVDLATAVAGLAEPERLPERAALVTFDDGYRSTLTEALPCLRRFGCPAVVFVPTGFVGGVNGFDRDIEPEEPMCSWDELRELQENGVAVQAHGVSHRRFSALGRDDLIEELAGGKAALETELGRSVDALAYPYGDDCNPNLTPTLLESLGYHAACLYGGGPNVLPVGDPFRLKRLAMGPDSDLTAMLAETEAKGSGT